MTTDSEGTRMVRLVARLILAKNDRQKRGEILNEEFPTYSEANMNGLALLVIVLLRTLDENGGPETERTAANVETNLEFRDIITRLDGEGIEL